MRFSKRALVERTVVYVRRMWLAEDGLHRVSEFTRLLEGRGRVYYAEVAISDGSGGRWSWQVLSRHKRRGAAERACQRDARLGLVRQ
jgi:hypothetical protein